MFRIGWELLQSKDNIIAKETPKIRGSFAMKASNKSMLKAIYAQMYWKSERIRPQTDRPDDKTIFVASCT